MFTFKSAINQVNFCIRFRFIFIGVGVDVYPIDLAPFVKKNRFQLLNCFCVFIKHQLPIFVWALGSLFYLIELNISPMPIPDSLDYSSYIVSLEIRWTNFSHFILYQNCFSYLPLQVKFESIVLLASYYLSYLFPCLCFVLFSYLFASSLLLGLFSITLPSLSISLEVICVFTSFSVLTLETYKIH